MGSNWNQRGAGAVNAGADFVSGITGAFKGLGARFKRGKHAKFIEAFCAMIGDVMSQNGRMKPEELKDFRKFLLNNHENPAIGCFDPDELVKKVTDYGIAAFLCDEETIDRAIIGLEKGSDYAKLATVASLAVAYADGDCDADESNCIRKHAQTLQVDMTALAQEFGVALPELNAPVNTTAQVVNNASQNISTPPPQQQAASGGNPCPVCNGVAGKTDCNFCKGSGYFNK